MMATAPQIDFPQLMGPVARRLLGEPNKALSTPADMRFGAKGSVSIATGDGTFYDHEANIGGGVLDLIARQVGGDRTGAVAWLEREGLIDRQRRERPAPAIFYDYADADGVISYRVERRGKGAVPPFLQHGPDGRGGFHTAKGCMRGVTRLPYRLPQLIAADPGEIVFVCEGEKAADRLARDGLVATTNSGGAGKFGPELVPYFAGRRVVILEDNDAAGRAHVLDVEAKLRPVAAAVAIVRLGGGEKADVSDWLAAGGSAHQLVHQFAEPALAAAVTAPATFALADLDAWSRTAATPTPFYMAGHIPEGEVTLLTGAGGGNKSTFGQQLATCSAVGHAMLGVEVKRGPAIYLTAEDDEPRLHWMQEHICQALRISMASLAGGLHLASIRGRLNNELATFDAEGRLQPRETFALLRSTLEVTKARLLVLDNVAHLFSGNENDRGQVTAFVNLLYQLCRDLGVTIVLIAHRNKAGDSYSGSTAWLNAVRSQLVIERPEDGHDPDARLLTIGKANYARPDQQLAFRWHDFALIRDEDLPAEERATMAAAMNAAAEDDAFIVCLLKATAEKRNTSPSPNAPNYAPRIFARMPSAGGTTVEGFERAMERLLHRGEIVNGQPIYQRENRQWVTGLGCTKVCTNRAPNPAPTLHQGAPESCIETHAHVTLDTTYLSGSAHGGRRPGFDEDATDPFDPRNWGTEQ